MIVSATPIPGNETAVSRIIKSLFKQGANVIYNSIERAHVSCHASSEELLLMLNLTNPKCAVAIHGETRHLVRDKQRPISAEMPPENVVIPENEGVIEFGPRAHATWRAHRTTLCSSMGYP